jgi:hypothetical protein
MATLLTKLQPTQFRGREVIISYVSHFWRKEQPTDFATNKSLNIIKQPVWTQRKRLFFAPAVFLFLPE